MPSRPFTGFRSVPELRWHGFGGLSLVVHVLVLAAVAAFVRAKPVHVTFVELAAPETTAAVELPPFGGARRALRPPPGRGVPVAAAPAPRGAAERLGLLDSVRAQGPAAGPGNLIVPRFGDGRLWVKPRVGPPGRNVAVLNVPVDSAARVRIRQLVDSFNAARAAEPRGGLPSWTTEIVGAKFGLDSQYVYIAGIKVPAVLLSLLPLPQGNIEEAERAAILNAQRYEIQRDAARQAAREDQRRYAEELRRRKQAERDAERRRRERPPAERPIP